MTKKTEKANLINRNSNTQTDRSKTYDLKNGTTHTINISKKITWEININELTIRKFLFILGVVIGFSSYYFYSKYTVTIWSFLNKAKMFVFNISPFASDMLEVPNFKYAFIFGCVFTGIGILIIFCCGISVRKNIFLILLICIIFSAVYLYLNFGLCYLIIKIPIFYKVISSILMIVINLFGMYIVIGICELAGFLK